MTAVAHRPAHPPHADCAPEIERLQDINGQLLDGLRFVVRWHDQLREPDIRRLQEIIARAEGERE